MATPNIASTSNGSILDCQSPFFIKLLLLGASYVGKTCFVLRLVEGEFHDYQTATMGAAHWTYDIKVNNRTVKFTIWDIAGSEAYDRFASMYYRNAQTAIVLYDITNMNTFDKAKYRVKELQSQATPNIVIALSGNRADLDDKREVQFKEAQVYADKNNLLFMETSALTAQNVTEIFVAVAMKTIQAAYKEIGWSPLMVASQNGHLDAVMALIETGAGVSQTNKDIKKAQDVAVKNGHKNVVELLEACKTNIFRQQFHVMYEIKEQQIRQQKVETEKQFRDVRQQKEETEKQLRDVKQQKKKTEKQLREARQQNKEAEKQLQEARQQNEQTEKQLQDVRQGKEEAEKQLDDVKKNSEKLLAFVRDNQTKTEQQLRCMWQQNEQTEQQIHEMRQQKEQAEQQLHDTRQQKGEMKEQIDAYEKRLEATGSMLVQMQLKNKSLEQELVQQSDTSQITQTANFIYYSLLNSSVPSSADENEHP